MGYRLRDNLYFCISNQKTVFLDVQADRYFGLPPEADRAFQRLAAGDILSDDDYSRLNGLLSQALLIPVAGASLLQSVQVRTPVVDRMPAGRQDAPGWPSLPALFAYHCEPTKLADGNLSAVLSYIRRRKSMALAQAPAKPPDSIDLRGFFRARQFINMHNECLRSSIALTNFLAGKGCFPDLIIGARMKPFGAHAWVQDGQTVLNDHLDSVLPFTPVLVI